MFSTLKASKRRDSPQSWKGNKLESSTTFVSSSSSFSDANTDNSFLDVKPNTADLVAADLFDSFNVSTTYTVLVPGGSEFNIVPSDYEIYLVAAMDRLAIDLEFTLKDMNLPIASSMEGNKNNNQTNFEAAVEVDLPTILESTLNVGFTDNPDVDENSNFRRGPCPKGLGVEMRDRCEEVKSTIALTLDSPMSIEEITLIRNQIEEKLEMAIITEGRLDVVLVERFPWIDIVVLSGYPLSAIESDNKNNSTTIDLNGPSLMDNIWNDGASSDDLSPIVIGGIVLGVLLCFILFMLVLCLAKRRKKQSAPPVIVGLAASKAEVDLVVDDAETATGLEWGIACTRHAAEGYDDEWIENKSIQSRESMGQTSHDMSTISSMSSYPVYHGAHQSHFVGGRHQATIQENDSVSDGSAPSIAPHSDASTFSQMYYDDDDDDQSCPYSVDSKSMESSIATAQVMQGSQIVSGQGSVGGQSLPMPLNLPTEDFNALECAIYQGDWKALSVVASNLDTYENSEKGSTCHEEASMISSNNSTAYRKIRLSDDDSTCDRQTVATYDSSSSSSDMGRLNAWQEVIDEAKAFEIHQLIEDGNWAGIIEAAARYQSELDAVEERNERTCVEV